MAAGLGGGEGERLVMVNGAQGLGAAMTTAWHEDDNGSRWWDREATVVQGRTILSLVFDQFFI